MNKTNYKVVLSFLLPAFIIYTALLILPIIGSFAFSFLSWNGIKGRPMEFVALKNFIQLINDASFWLSVKNISWFMILTLITQLPLGLLLAILLSKQFKGYAFFKATYFIPQVVSTTVIGLVWYFILMPTGTLNSVLRGIGLENIVHNWLVEKNTAMTSIILVNTWVGIGFHMTVSYAAIQAIPESIIDAALIDGCVGLRKIFFIIIPLIWESIISSIIIIITAVLKTFDLVYVMTEGGPNGLTDVPSTLLYKSAFLYDNYGKAAAIGVFIFLTSIILTLFSLSITRRETIEM